MALEPPAALELPAVAPAQNCAKNAFWSEANIPAGERQDRTIDQLPTTSPPQGVTCPQADSELPLQLAAEIQRVPTASPNHCFIVRASLRQILAPDEFCVKNRPPGA